jgi:hypothetical protein
MSNGHDISKYFNDKIPEILKNLNLVEIIYDNINSIIDWKNISRTLSTEMKNTLYSKIFSTKKEYIILNSLKCTKNADQPFIKFGLEWMNNVKRNFKNHKSDLLDCIKRTKTFNKDTLNHIIDTVDDDDIEMACTYKLLPTRISNKYNFEMKRKVLENLKYWDEFLS